MEDKRQGRVVWFDAKKGIGFISPTDGGKDLFVHWTNILAEGFKTLEAQQSVEYRLGENHKGVQAVDVKVLADEV